MSWNKVDSPIVSGPLALSLRKRLPIGTSSTVFRAAGGKKIRKVSVKLTTQHSHWAERWTHPNTCRGNVLSLSAFSCFGFYVFYRKSSPALLENFSHTDTLSIRLIPLQHLFSGTTLLQSNGTRSTLTIWDLIKTLENPGGRASGEELHAFMLEMFGEVERPFRGTTRTAGPQCAGTEHRRSVLDYSPDVPPCEFFQILKIKLKDQRTQFCSHTKENWLENAATPKLLQPCCLWNGCFEEGDQVCDLCPVMSCDL